MTQLTSNSGHRLDWLKVQLTRLCNFSCSFCSQADWASNETIDIEQLNVAVLSRLQSLRLLIITGGEPLARFKELEQLSRLTALRGTEVGIFSNLSLLTAQRAATLSDAGVGWYRTTLNGSHADVHEKSYPQQSFEKTLRGIEAARTVGSQVKIRSTVCRANIEDLPALVALVYSMGIAELDFRPYLPLGDCNTHTSFALDSHALLSAAASLLRLKREWQGRVQIKLLPNWFDFLYRDLTGESVAVCESCNCGRKYLYIDATGNYRSCAGHRAVLGNMSEQHIEEIWSSNAQLQETRDYKQDSYCVSCPRAVQCHASNCHLVNFEAHGRFDKVNPTCPVWNFSKTSALLGFDMVRAYFKDVFSKVNDLSAHHAPPSKTFWIAEK